MPEALIRRCFAAFDATDIALMLDCLADDIVVMVAPGGGRAAAECVVYGRCFANDPRPAPVAADG